MILAGDIGGTNTRLALFRDEQDHVVLVDEDIFPSRPHAGLNEIVALFFSKRAGRADVACFGIAGPVVGGRAVASNLAWTVDAAQLSQQNSMPVWLINDLESHGYGVLEIPASDLFPLNEGVPSPGNCGLIAAGTGLGEAGMFWDGTEHHVFASEGGHADFAPATDLEIALHGYLKKRFGHVSVERVLSGPGIKNIYDFLASSGMEDEPKWLKDELSQAPDAAVRISEHGLNSTAAICERTLEVFAGAYGAEAGNLALRLMAIGGIYVSGGIAGKIMPIMKRPLFMKAFIDKGRMETLLRNIPVKVIINDRIGLYGAARYAFCNSRKNLKTAYSQSPQQAKSGLAGDPG